jgi:putative tricarboxylic transport membrane protein
MAKKGRPDLALSLGIFGSLIGGIVSAFALFTIAPAIANLALKMGSWEQMSVCLLGLCIVAAVAGDDVIRGLMGAVIGLVLGAVGMDSITGIPRLTFGFWQLTGGITMLGVMMGFFAIREICNQIADLSKPRQIMEVKKISLMPPWKELKNSGPALFFGSIVGILVGVLPGIGQTPACILAYNQTKRVSKHPHLFGTGVPEGVVASETGNSACNGGALVPLITLGIPGDGVTVVLIGGLMIHGLEPGPLFIKQNPDVVGTIMWSYLIASVALYFMLLGLLRVFIKMINVKYSMLFPGIIAFCLFGIYAVNNRIFDVWVMIIFGAVGIILYALKIDVIALLLGYVLGPLIEVFFRRGLIASNGRLSAILERPAAVIFLVTALLFLFWPAIKHMYLLVKQKTARA